MAGPISEKRDERKGRSSFTELTRGRPVFICWGSSKCGKGRKKADPFSLSSVSGYSKFSQSTKSKEADVKRILNLPNLDKAKLPERS